MGDLACLSWQLRFEFKIVSVVAKKSSYDFLQIVRVREQEDISYSEDQFCSIAGAISALL